MKSSQVLITTILSLLLVNSSESAYFCDLKAIDNVWNVGHMVHMSRCGQVWVYDPRMDGGYGAFIRDYSWYGKARDFFNVDVVKRHGEYKPEYLHFAAFSFQEVNCIDVSENIHRDCSGSVRKWNGLSIMSGNYTAYTFKYGSDFWEPEPKELFLNPLNFPYKQNVSSNPNYKRDRFWPAIHKLVKSNGQNVNFGDGPGLSFALIHSALFSVKKNILYIVLLSPNELYFCVTYLDMTEMLHDVQKWPKAQSNGWTPDWAPCNLFTGTVVGMFYDESNGKSYIVGRVSYENRYYADQIYTMETRNGLPVTFAPVLISDEELPNRTEDQNNLEEHPQNLRTYFGCDRSYIFNGAPKPVIRVGRKKRSNEDPKESYFEWKVIKQELRDDWKSLSAKTLLILFLTFILVRLWRQLMLNSI